MDLQRSLNGQPSWPGIASSVVPAKGTSNRDAFPLRIPSCRFPWPSGVCVGVGNTATRHSGAPEKFFVHGVESFAMSAYIVHYLAETLNETV